MFYNQLYYGLSNKITDYFGVDQSIVTLHSPDIEFDPTTQSTIHNNDNVKFRIVGIAEFDKSAGDIDIQTTTPTIKNTSGFIHQTMGVSNWLPYNNITWKESNLWTGYYYKDSFVTYEKNYDLSTKQDTVWEFVESNKYTTEWGGLFFKIYTWHRGGSLTNDINRPSDAGVRTSELKTKIISNLKYSSDTTYFDDDWYYGNYTGEESIGTPKVFADNDNPLIRMDKISTLEQAPNYYGCSNKLAMTDEEYSFYVSESQEPSEETTLDVIF
jgi:hypothetical protein